jgi:TPR repeat protein
MKLYYPAMISRTTHVLLLLAATGAYPLVAAPTASVTSTEASVKEKSPELIYQEGVSLLKANDGEESMKKGFQMVLKAAEKGYLRAESGVAYLYNVGMGTPKDNALAIKWFRLAAEKGHTISQYNLGKLLVADEAPLLEGFVDRKAQHEDGVKWIRKAADDGLLDAQTTYGVILYQGDFETKRDPAAAVGYLKPAADAGSLEAMNVLGVMHDNGDGVPHDPTVAERFLRQAAMAGHVKAQANLGEFLNRSPENSEARIAALAWLFIAEESENVMAKKILSANLQAISPADSAAAKKMATEIKQQIAKEKK